MPAIVQQASVGDRLRNFFRLVGNSGTQLDETISPVAVIEQLGGPPWRTNEENFGMQAATVGGAALFSSAGILVPGSARGVAVVRKVIVSNTTAAALAYNLELVDAPQAWTNYATVPVVNVEHMRVFTGGFPNFLPPVVFGGQFTPDPYTSIAKIVVPANSIVQLDDLGIALRAGQGGVAGVDGIGLAVTCQTLNTLVIASFFGTWYPDAI